MKTFFLKSLCLVFLSAVPCFASLHVVTTTSDLAAITREIGGDKVDVESIAKGYQDPHFVEAKPSYLLKLGKADLFIQIGLELEVAWIPPLLTNARNSKILPGQKGFLDVSQGCEILEKNKTGVDRSQGDVHPFGNPHYWLDPANGKKIAEQITDKLCELDLANSFVYKSNLATFESKLDQKIKEWDFMAKGFKNQKIVTYHNSWPNFVHRFGLVVANFVEPRPGIPPSPAHVSALTKQIKNEKIPVILMEPYFDSKLPEKIAQEAGIPLLVLPPSVGAEKDILTYFDLFDHDLKLLRNVLEGGN